MLVTVVGIDPSYRNTGLFKLVLNMTSDGVQGAKFIDCSLVRTEKGKTKTVRTSSDDYDRARKLYKLITQFVADADVVCVEMPIGSQSAASMKSYGVCIALMASINKPLIQLTPNEVKLAMCGNKNATKSQMIDAALKRMPNASWLTKAGKPTATNEHLADALGAILAGIKSNEFKLLTAIK